MDTQLFLLFPEYSDSGNPTEPIFATTHLMTYSELVALSSKLKSVVQYLRLEECQMLYDKRNFQAYKFPISILEDCYPDIETYYRTLLEKHFEDWKECSMSEKSDTYTLWNQVTCDNVLCEVAKRCANKCFSCGILNHGALNQDRIPMTVNNNSVTLLALPIQIKDVANWMEHHRKPERIYDHNPKHGQGGIGKHPSHDGNYVSDMLFDTIEDAAEMMHKAVKCKRHLYYYDAKYNKYIKFMDGGNGTYHAYHIQSLAEENRILHDVKKLLDLLCGPCSPVYE